MTKRMIVFIFCAMISLAVILNAVFIYADPVYKISADDTLILSEDNADITSEDKIAADGNTVTEVNSETEEKPGLSEKIARFFADSLSGLPDELICFIVSMIPVVELRGGLIIAALKDIPLWRAIAVCIAGNLLPVPFILWLITPIFTWLKKTRLFKGFVEKLEKKSMNKSDSIAKKEFWGLVIFVGIPLPGTGAWTGSLIASMLNIKVKKAFPAVCVGLVMATVIMCLLTYGIPWLVSNI